jgi:NTP pyrophosphatase (non-canonical NTP hydrolase)
MSDDTLDPTPYDFRTHFNEIAREIHQTAVEKGWWKEEQEVLDLLRAQDRPELAAKVELWYNATKLDLIHSELAEALEGLRHHNPASDHIPEFTAVEEELADVFIRMCDLAAKRGWRLPEAIEAKMEFNDGRAYMHGGKAV